MPVNFRPDRQHAAHVIEPSDVLLVRGTTVFDPTEPITDIRFVVREDGQAQRAMWQKHNTERGEPGATNEFHLWIVQLDSQSLTDVRDMLARLWQAYEGFRPQLDGQDNVTSISFWAGGDRVKTLLHRSGGLRKQYSVAQVDAFTSIIDFLSRNVPASLLKSDICR